MYETTTIKLAREGSHLKYRNKGSFYGFVEIALQIVFFIYISKVLENVIMITTPLIIKTKMHIFTSFLYSLYSIIGGRGGGPNPPF